MQHGHFGNVTKGDLPVLVVAPHVGTKVPDDLLVNSAWVPIDGRLSDPAGIAWVAAARGCGITAISATVHPCVIDLNVATDNRSLTPRLNRVGLCRTHTSRGEPLYPEGSEPDEFIVSSRIAAYWQPFHELVTAEIIRLRKLHDNVVVVVSHASSWLSPYREQAFGTDFNLGTWQGAACDRRLVSALTDVAEEHGRSWVVNGKLGGVFAARCYGLPHCGVHAIEIETAGKWRNELELDTASGLESATALAEMDALLKAAAFVVSGLPSAVQSVLPALEAARYVD